MREAGGRTVLMDFGAGKDATAPIEGSDFAGTPVYIALEVFRGAARNKVSDIDSLGVLLFYLVTREYPVAGDTREDIETRHATPDRRHLRDVRPDLPPEFVRTVEKAIASDPTERYRSAGAFEMALAEISGRGPSRLDRVPPPTPKVAWLAIAAAASVLAMAGVAYTVFGRGGAVPSVPQQLAARTGENGAAVSPASMTPEANHTYDIETTFHPVK
jgi:serine/threonine protein kinase